MCTYETYTIETEKGLINVFFEKQYKLYCLVHTVNNILQAHVYSFKDFLDLECKLNSTNIIEIDKKNKENNETTKEQCLTKVTLENKQPPLCHISYFKKGLFYFGNFSVNILYILMHKHNMDLFWIDNEDVFQKIKKNGNCNTIFNDTLLNNNNLIAFIINVVKLNIFNFYKFRHFYIIRKISGHWFQLDSSSNKPVMLSQNKDVIDHLLKILINNKNKKSDNYVIQVFKKENKKK